jgi:5-methylcytosine-specific restriction endonuclease McrA
MARLSSLKPTLTTLSPTIAYMPSDERERDRFRAQTLWRKWYGLVRWKQIRAKVLLRDGYQCRICSRLEPNTSRLSIDHIRPHRGDEALFWDEANLQVLCKQCHDGTKQRQERRER